MSMGSRSVSAAHGRLWYDDPVYRMAWIVGPQCVVVLILCWTFGLASVSGGASSPWGKPVDRAAQIKEIEALRDQVLTNRDAIPKLESLARLGSPLSNLYLGTFYDPTNPKYNTTVHQDIDKSLSYYQTATQGGNSLAQQYLRDFYADPKFKSYGRMDYQKNCQWVSKKTDDPSAIVLSDAGTCYASGWGDVKIDLLKAVENYDAAAKKGNATAMAALGYYNRNGLANLPKNEDLAVRYYRQAADLKDPLGLHNLGSCYDAGCGTLKPDPREAARLIALALEAKSDVSLTTLTTKSNLFTAQFWQEMQRQLASRALYSGPFDGTPNTGTLNAVRKLGTP